MRNLSRSKGFNQFGLPPPEELFNFEKKLGIGFPIPEEFKKFLAKYNGGSFDECVFLDGPRCPVVVAMFLPFCDTESNSINSNFNYFHKEISDGVIPFASDPGGNYFLLGFKPDNKNKVYFWDHETQKSHELAENFESFVNALVVDD